MSERDAFQDGREQGWRDKQAEIERLQREILHYEHQCELGSQKIDSLMKYAERLRQDAIALQREIGRLTDNNPSPEQTRTEN